MPQQQQNRRPESVGSLAMGNIGATELIMIALVLGVPALALYWLIRIAVRHGTKDAHRD